jgi:hypothetical protein
MKISNAIAIIAMVLQGLLLHTDARLGRSLDLDDEDYPAPASTSYFRDDSEFDVEENFIGSEEESTFLLESDVGTAEEAGSGVYLQASSSSGSSSHGRRCMLPFPTACGRNSRCMPRTGSRRAICVDNNKCIPSGVVITGSVRPGRCCNGSAIDEHAWTTNPYEYIIYCL